jgi:hypothetical protein
MLAFWPVLCDAEYRVVVLVFWSLVMAESVLVLKVVTTGWDVGNGEESTASEPKWSLSSSSASAKLFVSSVYFMMKACSVGL